MKRRTLKFIEKGSGNKVPFLARFTLQQKIIAGSFCLKNVFLKGSFVLNVVDVNTTRFGHDMFASANTVAARPLSQQVPLCIGLICRLQFGSGPCIYVLQISVVFQQKDWQDSLK